ncbi:MAG: UbiX family flavin prenyltransferase, partial [Desulfurivibrionaceae bacterium]
RCAAPESVRHPPPARSAREAPRRPPEGVAGTARPARGVLLPGAAIANGFSGNLIHRAADVTLKERRPLLLAVRETPFNRTHLRNMLKVHDAGATICPPLPSFYHKPKSLREMARIFGGRLADLMGIEVEGQPRWGE